MDISRRFAKSRDRPVKSSQEAVLKKTSLTYREFSKLARDSGIRRAAARLKEESGLDAKVEEIQGIGPCLSLYTKNGLRIHSVLLVEREGGVAFGGQYFAKDDVKEWIRGVIGGRRLRNENV